MTLLAETGGAASGMTMATVLSLITEVMTAAVGSVKYQSKINIFSPNLKKIYFLR